MKTKSVKRQILPTASMGNERVLTVIRYGAKTAGPKAYIQAGLHADEAPGFMVMHHLINRLDRADADNLIKGQIILVPVANPIGVSQWRDETLQGRFDFYNSVNFNREHLDITEQVAAKIKNRLGDTPDDNVDRIRLAMGEVIGSMAPVEESPFLKHCLLSLSYDADIVLDLHCDYEAVLHLYMGTPLWPDASDLSAQLGAEVTLLATVSGGDPYDEACSRIWWELAEKFPSVPIPSACLAATVELRGMADVSHSYGRQDADNIFQFLQRRGMVRGQAGDLPTLRREATPLRGVEQVMASSPGVVVFLKRPGENVDKGEVIAEIINPLENSNQKRVTKVESGTAGILFSINRDRYARPGRILAKIAGKNPLKEKGEKLLTL